MEFLHLTTNCGDRGDRLLEMPRHDLAVHHITRCNYGGLIMPLEFSNLKPRHDAYLKAILFEGLDGDVEVPCGVSTEAVQKSFGVKRGHPRGLLGAFDGHKIEIEQMASAKYDKGELTDMIVMVTTKDL
jgi:hypothetical protein